MSWVATTKGIDANLVGDLMMQAVEYRFGASQTAPHEVEWLSDNGSCYIASITRSFARALSPENDETCALDGHVVGLSPLRST